MFRHRFPALALATLVTGMTAACGGTSKSHGPTPEASNSVVYTAPTAVADACKILGYQSFGELIGPPDKTGPDKLAQTGQEQSASCYVSFNPPTGQSGSAASILLIRTDLMFWQDAATAKEQVLAGNSNAAQDPKSAAVQVSGVGTEAYHYILHDFGSGLLEVVLDAGSGNLEVREQVDTQRPTDWTAQQLDSLYQMMAASMTQNLSAVQHAALTWGSSQGGNSAPPSS